MKNMILALLLVWLVASDVITQDRVTILPNEAQIEPKSDFIEYTVNFLKGYLNNYYCDRQRSLFKQCDKQWGNQTISEMTVWQVGCLMTSAAMALNSRGKTVDGKSINPGTLNTWLKTHGGYIGDLFVWKSISPLGLKYTKETNNHDDIRHCLWDLNWEVILNVRFGGHYVIATGYDQNGYSVNDPGFTQESYSYKDVVKAYLFST